MEISKRCGEAEASKASYENIASDLQDELKLTKDKLSEVKGQNSALKTREVEILQELRHREADVEKVVIELRSLRKEKEVRRYIRT